MSLQNKIVENQRFFKYEKTLRRIRQRIFDYEDEGKLDKAHRIINKIKKICGPRWEIRCRRLQDRYMRTME